MIADEDGAYSDWLELQNRGDMVADLSGYYLSDDASDPDKWQIPAGTSLDAGELVVVFASGKDRGGDELHTNFKLDELGGDLLLTAPDGSTIVSDFSGHPALGANQAYGSFDAGAGFVNDFLNVPTPGVDNANVDPIITEFLADNNDSIVDSDGDTSDWVELHNPGIMPVDLTGWYLSDDTTLGDKWEFPAVTLGAGEYMTVFASGKDRNDPAGELHTNFRLSASGDYLALVRPDGTTVTDEFAVGGVEFAEQFANVSFGVRGQEMFEVGYQRSCAWLGRLLGF